MGAQWLSGRVLEMRTRDRGFQPHKHHRAVFLSKTDLALFSSGSTQEECHDITKNCRMEGKESNQTNKKSVIIKNCG